MARQLPSARARTAIYSPEYFLLNELFALASLRDLDTVLHKALGIAVRGLGAEAGSILFQEQILHCLRLGAFRPEALARIEHWETVIGQRLADAAWNIPHKTSLPISASKIADIQLMLLNVPLLRETTVVGSLSLVLPLNNQIDESRRHLLSQIAGVVGQMASLIAELNSVQQHLKEIGVFYQVSQALVTTFDIHKLLADTMQLSSNVIDAGAASIMLIDEKRNELVFEVSHGSHSRPLRQQRISMDEGIAGWVAQHGHPVIANNARTDPRFSHRVDVRTGFLTQSIAAVPLKIKGRIIGVMEVLNKYAGGGFTHEDVQLMNSIATQVAIAIENSRLYQKVRQERDEVIKTEERIRQQLADRLHHGPGRLLSAIRTSLDHLDRLNDIKPEAVHNEINALRNLVRKATRDLRLLSFDIHSAVLETQGLIPALAQYADHLRQSESFAVHFEPVADLESESQAAAALFAVIQEAVNNVRLHAEARNLWLSLAKKEDRLLVTVRDDGQGFDIKAIGANRERTSILGLLNMRERTKMIGGELRIQSRTTAPKRGTTVQVSLPWSENQA